MITVNIASPNSQSSKYNKGNKMNSLYRNVAFGANYLDKFKNAALTNNAAGVQPETQTAPEVSYTKTSSTNLLTQYLNNAASINKPAVTQVKPAEVEPVKPYKNDLRTLFRNNDAKILAIVLRTFNAQDKNGNEYIDGNETCGTFLNAIKRLDEIKAQGFNTLHLLPISPPGKDNAMGTAGSVS